MSFKKNEYSQMKLDDRMLSLTNRETRMLHTSWAENFNRIIFPRINGVEGIPSVLRRRYDIDNIPAFGLPRLKMWFSLKIGAVNVKRVLAYAGNNEVMQKVISLYQKLSRFFRHEHLTRCFYYIPYVCFQF